MIKQLSASVAEAGVSAPRMISELREVTVTVIPESPAYAKCQFTTSSRAEVYSDDATWQDWPHGEVSNTTTDVFLFRVTAVRLSATGAAKLEILGNDK